MSKGSAKGNFSYIPEVTRAVHNLCSRPAHGRRDHKDSFLIALSELEAKAFDAKLGKIDDRNACPRCGFSRNGFNHGTDGICTRCSMDIDPSIWCKCGALLHKSRKYDGCANKKCPYQDNRPIDERMADPRTNRDRDIAIEAQLQALWESTK